MYIKNPSTCAASQLVQGYLLADPAPSAGNEPAHVFLYTFIYRLIDR